MSCCSKFLSFFRHYETPKMEEVSPIWIAIFAWVIRLLILLTILVLLFYFKKHQHVETEANWAFMTELKGISYSKPIANTSEQFFFDSTDLRIPPHGTHTAFLTTNLIVTNEQEQSTCTNEYRNSTRCVNNTDCKKPDEPYVDANGLSTGKCNETAGYCILKTWCPPEDETLPNNGTSAVLNSVHEFTLLITNHVYFPHSEKRKSNLDSVNQTMLENGCLYDPDQNPYCPIFSIKTMVDLANREAPENKNSEPPKPEHEKDEEAFRNITITGAVISIAVKWDCNFDKKESKCKPTYRFTRLDGKSLSPGYNFHYANHYKENGIEKRKLIKAFGILFVLNTDARAGKFDPLVLIYNFGASVAYLQLGILFLEFCLKIDRKCREGKCSKGKCCE